MFNAWKRFWSTLLSKKGCGNCKHWIDENYNHRCDYAEKGQCSDCIIEPFSKWERIKCQ